MSERPDACYLVTEPAEFHLEGGLVWAEIKTGGRTFCFAMSPPTFLGSFAKAGLVAHEWRAGRGAVVPLELHTND